MTIILISGKQGSGKTTLQKALVEELFKRTSQGAAIVNFADIIYEMHDSVLEILHRYWPKRDIVKDGPLLQLLGTEWGRKTIDDNIWVKCLRRKADLRLRHSKDGGILIVGDCRFENEFDAFPEALRVRLDCPEEIRKKRCSMWRENSTHPSEIGLDNYALSDKFDLYLGTDTMPVAGCVSLILTQLDKKSWVERRKC